MSAALLKHITTSGGTLDVDVVSRRVVCTRMTGHLDAELARQFLASLEEWLKLGGTDLLAFHDWDAVLDYDTEARSILTPWSKLHRPKFDRVHMLVRTRTLAWGIRIVNSLTANVMLVHHTRQSFEQARSAAL